MINFMVIDDMSELKFLDMANEAFRAEHGGLKKPELFFTSAIRQRGLTPTHFERFEQFAEAHRDHLRNPLLFDYERSKKRAVFRSVGLTRDITPGNSRFAIPLQYRMEISVENEENMMCSEERSMPVRIELQHVNYRHIKRTGKLLIYGQTETQRSFMLALGLSKVISMKMDSNRVTETPIILPHKEGIFVGYAIATSTCREDHKLKGTQTIRQKSGVPKSKSYARPSYVTSSEAIKRFSDDYDCVIVLKTFYSHAEMNEDYLKLWKSLYPLIDSDKSEALQKLWWAFQGAKTEEEYQGYLNVAEPISARLAEIVSSSLWQNRVIRLQQGHLPSNMGNGEFGLPIRNP